LQVREENSEGDGYLKKHKLVYSINVEGADAETAVFDQTFYGNVSRMVSC
jgi:hypothetical protein